MPVRCTGTRQRSEAREINTVSNKNTTVNSTKLMRRLVQLSESQIAADKGLSEAGTATTDLPPSTSATRQLQKDVATAGKEGIPAPVGAEPGEQNAAQIPAQLDPNGEDMPADIRQQAAPSGNETLGMKIPADLKPDAAGPGTDTVIPGSDTSAGADAEMAKAKAKAGLGLRLESATAEEVISFLIEHFGGADAFALALVADGAPFQLAEALSEGTADLDEVDERIVARLFEMAEDLLGEALVEESDDLDIEEAFAVLESLVLTEGFGQNAAGKAKKAIGTLKTAVQKFLGSREKPAASAGYQQLKQAHTERVKDKAQGKNRVISTQKRSFGVSSDADRKTFRREGPTARANR
jgi:hypothetical protein